MNTIQSTEKKTDQNVRPVMHAGIAKDEQGHILPDRGHTEDMGIKVVADNYQKVSKAQFYCWAAQ